MKNLIITIFLILPFLSFANGEAGLYNFNIKSALGKKIDIKNFKGKPLLIVNIATRCGYTGQLGDLEKLYKKYQNKGFTIVGVPSNDFGSQTPEGDKKVAEFCRLKYGVSFPITTKVSVTGSTKHPFVDHIVKTSGGTEIKWNFEKFLFNKEGNFIARFPTSTAPNDKDLAKAIQEALK